MTHPDSMPLVTSSAIAAKNLARMMRYRSVAVIAIGGRNRLPVALLPLPMFPATMLSPPLPLDLTLAGFVTLFLTARTAVAPIDLLHGRWCCW